MKQKKTTFCLFICLLLCCINICAETTEKQITVNGRIIVEELYVGHTGNIYIYQMKDYSNLIDSIKTHLPKITGDPHPYPHYRNYERTQDEIKKHRVQLFSKLTGMCSTIAEFEAIKSIDIDFYCLNDGKVIPNSLVADTCLSEFLSTENIVDVFDSIASWRLSNPIFYDYEEGYINYRGSLYPRFMEEDDD